MPNTRQEVTAGARAFAEDPTLACPHLSNNPLTRGKQIRAVVIDEIATLATSEEYGGVPRINFGPYVPIARFVELTEKKLARRCKKALAEVKSSRPDIIEMYMASMLGSFGMERVDYAGIEEHLEHFAISGTKFPTTLMALTVAANRDKPATDIYRGLRASYGGMGKKFTSGESGLNLNLVFSELQYDIGRYRGLVLGDSESGGFRTCPTAVQDVLDSVGEEYVAEFHRIHGEDRRALCPASIEVYPDSPGAAERAWVWTIDTAEKSNLIEKMDELA